MAILSLDNHTNEQRIKRLKYKNVPSKTYPAKKDALFAHVSMCSNHGNISAQDGGSLLLIILIILLLCITVPKLQDSEA